MDNSLNTQTAGGEDAVSVALPTNLLMQIDAQIGSAFVDRDDFIRAAVRHYLEHIRESQNVSGQDVG